MSSKVSYFYIEDWILSLNSLVSGQMGFLDFYFLADYEFLGLMFCDDKLESQTNFVSCLSVKI